MTPNELEHELNQMRQDLESELDILRDRVNELERERDDMRAELNQLDVQMGDLSISISDLEEEAA